MNYKSISNYIIEAAIDRFQKGEPIMDIVRSLSSKSDELKEILEIVEALQYQRGNVDVPRVVLSEVLSKLPEFSADTVTHTTKGRSFEYETEKGRDTLSVLHTPSLLIQLYTMVMKSKLAIIGGVLVILVAGVGFYVAYRTPGTSDRPFQENAMSLTQQLDTAGGLVDTIVNDSTFASSVFIAEDEDVILIGADSAELTSFNQLYNENGI